MTTLVALEGLNSLSNDKIHTGPNWKQLLTINKGDPNKRNGLNKIKNIVGKEGNAGNQHFLLFPQSF